MPRKYPDDRVRAGFGSTAGEVPGRTTVESRSRGRLVAPIRELKDEVEILRRANELADQRSSSTTLSLFHSAFALSPVELAERRTGATADLPEGQWGSAYRGRATRHHVVTALGVPAAPQTARTSAEPLRARTRRPSTPRPPRRPPPGRPCRAHRRPRPAALWGNTRSRRATLTCDSSQSISATRSEVMRTLRGLLDRRVRHMSGYPTSRAHAARHRATPSGGRAPRSILFLYSTCRRSVTHRQPAPRPAQRQPVQLVERVGETRRQSPSVSGGPPST